MSMKCTALSFLVGSVVGAAAVIATVPGTKSFMKRTMKKRQARPGGRSLQYVVTAKAAFLGGFFAAAQNCCKARKQRACLLICGKAWYIMTLKRKRRALR